MSAGLPRSVTLHLTEACNLRCSMCYAWGETGRYVVGDTPEKPAVLDIALLKRVIAELQPAQPTYSLFGGEPLAYPHLEELIRAIKAAGSFVDTPTNATLLSRHASMLVETGFDSVRVSLDGPREVNDAQRGEGSYDKALAGIEALHRAKAAARSFTPLVSIIHTVTAENYRHIARFFLDELDLASFDWVTIQMQNFITEKMGSAYAKALASEFKITGDAWWRAFVRDPADFAGIDTVELARQVEAVQARLEALGKNVLLLPPTFSAENLRAYLDARWGRMADSYSTCAVPWNDVDITATGDVAPCHTFYDLVMGNLHERSFTEIWNGSPYRTLRAHIQQQGLLPVCHGCCMLYLAN